MVIWLPTALKADRQQWQSCNRGGGGSGIAQWVDHYGIVGISVGGALQDSGIAH